MLRLPPSKPMLVLVAVVMAGATARVVLAAPIEGAVIRVVTDQESWASAPLTWDPDNARYENPATRTMRLLPTPPLSYINVQVPADCNGQLVDISQTPPGVTVGQLHCGAAAAREFVNYPFLSSRPIVEAPGWTGYTARYLPAYGELYAGNTQVKFDWWVNETGVTPVNNKVTWNSGWLSLQSAGDVKFRIPTNVPTPADWLVTCPGNSFTSIVRITTSDGWTDTRTVEEPRHCL